MVTTTDNTRGTTTCAVQWPKTALRVTFGVIWLIDAVLKWLPGFRSAYMDTIMGQADGQPGWLTPWFRFWINLQHPHPMVYAYLVAVVETAIALAVIAGFARKLTYTAAIVFSLLIWATAEGFGGPYTSGASDVGTALIYALVFAALLLFSYYTGPSSHTVDYYLEQRISWWHRIAEVEPKHRRTARLAGAPDASAASPLPSPSAAASGPSGATATNAADDSRPTAPTSRHALTSRPRTGAGRR